MAVSTVRFFVKEGALLCIINLVLDGQGWSQGIVATGAGTTLRFEDVTFQRCSDSMQKFKVGTAMTIAHGAQMDSCTRCHFLQNRAPVCSYVHGSAWLING